MCFACFSPNNDVKLETVKESPVLQREGFTQNDLERTGNPVPTMEGEWYYSARLARVLTFRMPEWTFAKQKWQRTNNKVRGDARFETAQILPAGARKSTREPRPTPP